MDLFERYFYAVGSFLPRREQDDVVRELSEELRSQVEEREAEIGRPLTEAEEEQLLKQWGHPLLLASRYQPKRNLVGPVVFPLYWLVLKLALGAAVFVHVAAAVVFLANGRSPGEVIAGLARLPLGPLLVVFAWVTLVFAVLDRSLPRMRFVANWSPRSLPAPPKDDGAPSMASLIGEVVMATIFVLWLAAVPSNQWLLFGPAWTLIELGPVWRDIQLPLLGLAAAGLAIAWMNLVKPQRQTFRRTAKLIGNVVSLAVFIFLLNADPLIVPARSTGAGSEQIATVVNMGFRIGFAVTAIAIVIGTVYDAVRLANRLRVPNGWSPGRS